MTREQTWRTPVFLLALLILVFLFCAGLAQSAGGVFGGLRPPKPVPAAALDYKCDPDECLLTVKMDVYPSPDVITAIVEVTAAGDGAMEERSVPLLLHRYDELRGRFPADGEHIEQVTLQRLTYTYSDPGYREVSIDDRFDQAPE